MCDYTQLKSKKKNSSRGVPDSPERLKIRRFRRKGYRKNYKKNFFFLKNNYFF